VDVFFAISGFLIARLLVAELDRRAPSRWRASTRGG
jgi:peptidoglycan/LPS O-acetylase OafA/YrhL